MEEESNTKWNSVAFTSLDDVIKGWWRHRIEFLNSLWHTGVWGLSSCKVLELYFERCGTRIAHKMKKSGGIYIYFSQNQKRFGCIVAAVSWLMFSFLKNWYEKTRQQKIKLTLPHQLPTVTKFCWAVIATKVTCQCDRRSWYGSVNLIFCCRVFHISSLKTQT